MTSGPPSLMKDGKKNSKITQPKTKARTITIALNVEVFMKRSPDLCDIE